MFQAYLIICLTSGKLYIGVTSRSLRTRWSEHVSYAIKRPKGGALYAAIMKYGRDAFSIVPLCCAKTWQGICEVEEILIRQWGTLAPQGYNLTLGGEGRFGFRPSAESIERSASKHRGRPCHPNTRKISSETHKGKPKSVEHKAKIAASRRGKSRSDETKAKISAYWASRRKDGAFKTLQPYAHHRKDIAKCFKP